MKLVIRPIQDQQRELDMTHRLVSAIADELWKRYGGNDQLNWIEAERHLQRIVGQARAEARETEVAFVAPIVAGDTGEMPDEWLGQSEHDEQLVPSRATRRGAQAARRGQGVATSRRTRSKGARNGRAVAAAVS